MRYLPLVLVLFLLACSSPPPAPSPGEEPVSVVKIWFDYEDNEPRANEVWKGRWLYLSMNPVDQIETGGKLRMYMDQFQLNHIEMDFKEDDQVLAVDRGDSVNAMCKLRGMQLGLWLQFNECHLPGWSEDGMTVEAYAEWCGSLDTATGLETWGDLTNWSASRINDFEEVEPPVELAAYHEAGLKLMEEIYSTADDSPSKDRYTQEQVSEDPYISAAIKEIIAREKEIPVEIWQELKAAGCN